MIRDVPEELALPGTATTTRWCYTLYVIYQAMMTLSKEIIITFIDYSSDFDTISHKFIDKTLKRAGESIKVRVMFLSVYNDVTAFTTTSQLSGRRDLRISSLRD